MQRVSSADCTTPSGLTRMACAGHTCVQGARGSSKCMPERRRGSHGVLALDIVDVDHAFTLVGIALSACRYTRATANAARGIEKDLLDQVGHTLFLSLVKSWLCLCTRQLVPSTGCIEEVFDRFRFGPLRRLVRRYSNCSADFVLWDLEAWLQDGVGQLVGCLRMTIMIGDEQRIRANRAHNQRGRGHLSASCTHGHPVTIGNPQARCCLCVHFHPGIRCLLFE